MEPRVSGRTAGSAEILGIAFGNESVASKETSDGFHPTVPALLSEAEIASGHAKSTLEPRSHLPSGPANPTGEFNAWVARAVRMAGSDGTIRLHVERSEAGPLEVRIHVEGGEIFLNVSAESASGVTLLESGMDALRAALGEEGLKLKGVEIGNSGRDESKGREREGGQKNAEPSETEKKAGRRERRAGRRFRRRDGILEIIV